MILLLNTKLFDVSFFLADDIMIRVPIFNNTNLLELNETLSCHLGLINLDLCFQVLALEAPTN